MHSFVRWQKTTIAQLTYAINLFLGLSVGALGFQSALLLNENFDPLGWSRFAFLISLVALLLAIGLGIWCVINRLRDFRVTMHVARLREDEPTNSEELIRLRDLSERLGRRTWRLFWFQIGTFGLGIVCAVLGMWTLLSEKLL